MTSLIRELRFSLRALCLRPGFTGMVTLTLALGIGATTAIFSVISATLLVSLPYSRPDRLVAAFVRDKEGNRSAVSPSEYKEWQNAGRGFEAMAGYSTGAYNLVWKEQAVRVQALGVTPEFFGTLGVSPFLGPGFQSGDQAGRDKNVVLSHRLWHRQFNADPSVIGRVIKLDDQAYVICGVMSEDFIFIENADIFIPAELEPTISANGTLTIPQLNILARLRDKATLTQAKIESDAIIGRIASGRSKESDVELLSLHQLMTENIRYPLLLLLGAVALMLLIACANVTNLVLARNFARSKEIAVRVALGAGAKQIASYFLSECLLLSVLGGGGGVLLAFWSIRILPWLMPSNMLPLNRIRIDLPVLFFTLLVSLITGLVLAFIPTLRFAKGSNLGDSLKDNPGWILRGRFFLSLRNLLVTGQVALTLVLLVSAGLLATNVVRLLRVDIGFTPAHLSTFSISLPGTHMNNAQLVAFYRQAIEGIAALPGVTSACIVNPLPLGGVVTQGSFRLEGESSSSSAFVSQTVVSSDYFKITGIPLMRGRYFSISGSVDTDKEAIVDESFVRKFLSNVDPVGKRVGIGLDRKRQTVWFTIVGIVKDIKKEGIEIHPEATIYLPFEQASSPGSLRDMSFIVRTTAPPASLGPALQQVISNIDPDIPVFGIRTMDRIIAESMAPQRISTFLTGAFAIIATVLSCIGIYGILSQTVTHRTKEIGIRMALGADRRNIIRLLLGEGLYIIIAGMIVGAGVSLLVTRFMTHLLVGLNANHFVAFIAGSSLFLLLAVPACYLPARRATKVDPIISLKA